MIADQVMRMPEPTIENPLEEDGVQAKPLAENITAPLT